MFAGIVLYLLALPPTGLWWLGWFVAAFWSPLIRRQSLVMLSQDTLNWDWNETRLKKVAKTKKTGKYWFKCRPYRQIWVAGLVFWLIAVHWVCFPYWATCFGWFAMSCYLAIYFPLFVFFARSIHHTRFFGKFRIPVCVAGPIAWVATAFLQKHLMGGFAFASLEHTQMHQTYLIQIADLMGEYGVGAVMIFVGLLIGDVFPTWIWHDRLPESLYAAVTECDVFLRKSWRGFALRSFVLLLTFCTLILYGHTKLMFTERHYGPSKEIRVALLQGDDRAVLNAPTDWYDKVYEHFLTLARETTAADPTIDLVIWPESTCIHYWVDYDCSGLSPTQKAIVSPEKIDGFLRKYRLEFKSLARQVGIPQILGIPSLIKFLPSETEASYNSALLIDENGMAKARYDKMLLVMFGEYVPLADWLPDGFFLKTLCQRADFGKQPVCFPLRSKNDPDAAPVIASLNICFESVSPQLIRNQVLALRRQGSEPDLLINISNDGWFRHSSQIDMHLATHVFRAVENRKPYLTATNGGFSAYINSSGEIIVCGERQKRMAVVADVITVQRTPCYHIVGDWPAFLILCFAIVIGLTKVSGVFCGIASDTNL
ncbi:MAG: apolipoprotein N-acyltransferase [Planctomycetaceae bacterium]|nr:apolipoprotein N-acyltransferase [Planctomycetaceae bacterium]